MREREREENRETRIWNEIKNEMDWNALPKASYKYIYAYEERVCSCIYCYLCERGKSSRRKYIRKKKTRENAMRVDSRATVQGLRMEQKIKSFKKITTKNIRKHITNNSHKNINNTHTLWVIINRCRIVLAMEWIALNKIGAFAYVMLKIVCVRSIRRLWFALAMGISNIVKNLPHLKFYKREHLTSC